MPETLPTRADASPIGALRIARGLSREELAAAAGVSPRTVYNAELEGWRLQRSTQQVLALALGVDASELVLNDVREATNLPHAKIGQDGPTDGT